VLGRTAVADRIVVRGFIVRHWSLLSLIVSCRRGYARAALR
jgi:hypothetical protein